MAQKPKRNNDNRQTPHSNNLMSIDLFRCVCRVHSPNSRSNIHECGLKRIISMYWRSWHWFYSKEIWKKNLEPQTLPIVHQSRLNSSSVWLDFEAEEPKKDDLWWPFTKWCCRHLFFRYSSVVVVVFSTILLLELVGTKWLECQTAMHHRNRKTMSKHTHTQNACPSKRHSFSLHMNTMQRPRMQYITNLCFGK